MSLRAILVTLFIISIAIIGGTVWFSLNLFWTEFGAIIPPMVYTVAGPISSRPFVDGLVGSSLLVIFLLYLLFFLLVDRMCIYPVRAVSKVLIAFTENNVQMELPPFSQATTEIKGLTEAFVKFTNNVEEVHKRDMEISRLKSDFISTAAHQIRTPLTGIRWALEALEKEPLNESERALVKNATDKSKDLVGIVRTLLDISSIESGKYKYAFEMSDIRPIAEQVTKDFEELAQKGQVNLLYVGGDQEIPNVNIDRERIKWILNNLIENAIRYTPVGGSVRVTVDSAAARVFVRVRDTGIGIPEGDRTSIFERFYRAGNAIAKENQGNGLGLYIARTIAADHGGDLNFEGNKDGPGTTFILALPVVAQ